MKAFINYSFSNTLLQKVLFSDGFFKRYLSCYFHPIFLTEEIKCKKLIQFTDRSLCAKIKNNKTAT